MKRLIIFLSLIVCTMTFAETANNNNNLNTQENTNQETQKTTYLEVDLTPNLNLFNGTEVKGLRLPIFFGTTKKVTGVDFNLFTSEVDDFTGYQGGIFWGAGIFTRVNRRFRGFGFSIVNLHGGDSKGLLIGAINVTNEFHGLKLGLINYSKTRSGWEVGVLNNSAETFFQLGLINMTEKINGIQIGLINIAKNGVLPVMPLVNFNWHL